MVATSDNRIAPLFVDLDGSLIATDSLWESLIRLIKSKPLTAMLLPIWLLKGRAYFKDRIADHVTPDTGLLPYRACVLDHIENRKKQGGAVFLATAANKRVANAVANHLGVFSEVLASDRETNLSGARKLAAIQEISGSDFDYVGDAWVDVPIWQAANRATVVHGPARLLNRLKAQMPVQQLGEETDKISVTVILRAMRCHQWIKNVLLFVPLFLAHITSLSSWLIGVVAFVSFSLVASSVYVLNDILDIESDRSHPQKRERPFAAGQVPIKAGAILALILLSSGLAISFVFVTPTFAWMSILYAAVCVAYSLYFKCQPIIDLVVLAWFYTHRVVMGGVITVQGISISPWLLGFSVFFFMSLAMLKRFADLIELEKYGQTIAHGRFYHSGDLPLFRSMGPATACTSVFVLAMYISSERVVKLYSNPTYLWFICPILFYWIMRVWFLANRGQLHHDPIVFALRDRVSYLVAIAIGWIVIFAAIST